MSNSKGRFHLYLLILLVFSITSCLSGHKKVADDINTFTVTKSLYENSINATGMLETSRSVSYTCPLNGYDIQIIYLTEEGRRVHKGDTLIKLECAILSTAYNEALVNLERAQSDYGKAQAQQEMESNLLQSQIKTNEASTRIAMLDSSKLAFLSEAEQKITGLKLQKILIERDKLKRRLDFMKQINKSALSALQSKIARQEWNLKNAEDKLKKLNVISDTSGIVQYENLMTTGKKIKSGDIIWGNMPILKLVDLSDFQVRLFVNESQYQSIQNGQRVEMELDAVKKKILNGKILQKKPSGKPVQENSNVKQFEVLASVESVPSFVQPGVSVNCKVFLMELKDTVAIPLMSVFDEDSLKVVYVRDHDKFKKREITTGAISDKYVIVNKGLKPHEIISLIIPPDNLLK